MSLPGSAAESPHSQAADCRLDLSADGLSTLCWRNCIQCHEATDPIAPLDIYRNGDAGLCLKCHDDKTATSANNLLLNLVAGAGGNHPVGILYDPETAATRLHPSPKGPLLFFDAQGRNPKVHCSSCHDPMGNGPMLLRVSNSGSSLCLACHNK